MMKRLWFAGLVIFVFLGVFSLLSNLSSFTKPSTKDSSQTAEKVQQEKSNQNIDSQQGNSSAVETDGVLVTRVVDGDTIEIEGGQKVRYIGIDTPEVADPRKPVQCFGKEASNKNKDLVEGKRVRLEKDVSETDKYGRLLRYVYSGNIFVNELLVREGYAFSSTYPPDVKYQDLFNKAEKEAREANRGLWGSCGFARLPDGQVAGTKTTAPATDCVIKGNISSSSEKIYHLPGQRYYNQTVISESKGERWFCTEEEAQKAGWRKSKV